MALPCASAKRSRLLPVRDVNETPCALNFLETCRYRLFSVMRKGGALRVVRIVHRPGITSTSPSPLRDLCRPLASRAIGGYALAFDDFAPGSLTVFQSSRVA